MLVPLIAKRPNLQVSTYMSSLEFNSQRIQLAGGSADLTKKRIVAAAELVFSRDGFQGATTREIARNSAKNEIRPVVTV
jgi:hypothetical protein